MQNLGWDVQIDSFTEPNTVLGKAVNFKNVIATLDKNVSIYHIMNNRVESNINQQQLNFKIVICLITYYVFGRLLVVF